MQEGRADDMIAFVDGTSSRDSDGPARRRQYARLVCSGDGDRVRSRGAARAKATREAEQPVPCARGILVRVVSMCVTVER